MVICPLLDAFFKKLVFWAENSEEVEAVALVGSYAREDNKENSDVDLIILSKEHLLLLNDTTWLKTFGNYSNFALENYGAITSLRVFYDFAEIEFGLGDISWANLSRMDEGTKKVINGGFKILYDPSLILEKAQK